MSVIIYIADSYVDFRCNNERLRRPVIQLTKDGKVIAHYSSIHEAERETGIRHINECVNGKRKSAGGFLWKSKGGERLIYG